MTGASPIPEAHLPAGAKRRSANARSWAAPGRAASSGSAAAAIAPGGSNSTRSLSARSGGGMRCVNRRRCDEGMLRAARASKPPAPERPAGAAAARREAGNGAASVCGAAHKPRAGHRSHGGLGVFINAGRLDGAQQGRQLRPQHARGAAVAAPGRCTCLMRRLMRRGHPPAARWPWPASAHVTQQYVCTCNTYQCAIDTRCTDLTRSLIAEKGVVCWALNAIYYSLWRVYQCIAVLSRRSAAQPHGPRRGVTAPTAVRLRERQPARCAAGTCGTRVRPAPACGWHTRGPAPATPAVVSELQLSAKGLVRQGGHAGERGHRGRPPPVYARSLYEPGVSSLMNCPAARRACLGVRRAPRLPNEIRAPRPLQGPARRAAPRPRPAAACARAAGAAGRGRARGAPCVARGAAVAHCGARGAPARPFGAARRARRRRPLYILGGGRPPRRAAP